MSSALNHVVYLIVMIITISNGKTNISLDLPFSVPGLVIGLLIIVTVTGAAMVVIAVFIFRNG